jgi:hypothetical protein
VIRTAKRYSTIGLLGLSILVSSCARNSATVRDGAAKFTEDEKHRLYAAALAASDAPLDTQNFKSTCQAIGVFDQNGQPNDSYMTFVTKHFEWGRSPQSEDFQHQINTREKAIAYVEQHLPK